jgi:hypothetical protein
VRYYRADTVTDLNSTGQGGVPALFKSFTDQAGLTYEVFLETEPGVGIDWHVNHKLSVIGRRAWNTVVMHGFSTLDAAKPGDPGLLISSVTQMAGFLRTKNGKVDIRLMATWPRADQVVREGYDRAAAAAGAVKVVPAGDAWVRAIRRDPRTLGDNECSGFELGLSGSQVDALQQVAFDQLAAEGMLSAPAASAAPAGSASPRSPPSGCAAAHPPMRIYGK